jgi:hypothetical protein
VTLDIFPLFTRRTPAHVRRHTPKYLPDRASGRRLQRLQYSGRYRDDFADIPIKLDTTVDIGIRKSYLIIITKMVNEMFIVQGDCEFGCAYTVLIGGFIPVDYLKWNVAGESEKLSQNLLCKHNGFFSNSMGVMIIPGSIKQR